MIEPVFGGNCGLMFWQSPDRQRLIVEDHRERCVASEPLRVYLLAP